MLRWGFDRCTARKCLGWQSFGEKFKSARNGGRTLDLDFLSARDGKSRDITLPMKICLVKAMVFALVMYGCESWTIKKAEGQRIDAFEL